MGRRIGAIALAGLAWAAVAIGVVIPHYNAGAESDFYGRYNEVGGSASGILKTTFTHPLRIAEAALSGRDLHYLLDLVAPLAALSLLAPLVLVAALPELAINLLSSTTTQTSIHFHYTAGLIPVAHDRCDLRREATLALDASDRGGHRSRGAHR